jgi:hypothetical protein
VAFLILLAWCASHERNIGNPERSGAGCPRAPAVEQDGEAALINHQELEDIIGA